jgi:hypothetical protein
MPIKPRSPLPSRSSEEGSGAVTLVGPKSIVPERPCPNGPSIGMVMVPVSPAMSQTKDSSFCPSYFAKRYVNPPSVLRSMVVLVPETEPVSLAVGNEPKVLLDRVTLWGPEQQVLDPPRGRPIIKLI